MKVTFYKNIKTLSGKDKPGNMVFQSAKNHSVCIVRNYIKPRLTENNHYMGIKMTAAASLWKSVSLRFISDLKVYANAYNNQHLAERNLPLYAYNIFIMGIMKNHSPITSIPSLITDLGETLQEWIDNGFLKKVNTSHTFTATIE